MNNQNISKQIRKYVYKQCDLLDTIFSDLSDNDKAELLFKSLDSLENNASVHILNGYQIPDILDFSALRGTALFTRIQMYTDYYRSAKLQDKLYGTNVINTFPKIKSYKDIQKFSKNEYIQFEMFDSMKEYNESSGFDKVLFAKCLDEKDVKLLKSINPFFEYEYDKCNVNVDLDFMVKQMEKWQKHFPDDLDISYQRASTFIFELYQLRKEEAENLLIDLFREDLGIISSTSDDEEYIQMGQVKINTDNLALMFKDYYKYQKKVLKKRR